MHIFVLLPVEVPYTVYMNMVIQFDKSASSFDSLALGRYSHLSQPFAVAYRSVVPMQSEQVLSE